MASVSICPSPLRSDTATSARRGPLTDISNAANSPYRAVAAAAAAASKRPRSHSSIQRDLQYGPDHPPMKKQMLEPDRVRNTYNLRTPPRQQISTDVESRALNGRRGGNNTQPMALERKMVLVRERQNIPRQTKAQPSPAENLEVIRQWQKHYRRVFPQFVFYFESIPDDIRSRFAKQITSLGAHEEKFFSKDVTHVVTNRPIPTEQDSAPSSTDALGPSSVTGVSHAHTSQPQTINPLLLERSSESLQSQSNGLLSRQFTFEHALGRKACAGDAQRQQGTGGDVLIKAREMGMKIWAVEKLQRMMTTMFETDVNLPPHHGYDTRSHAAGQGLARNTRASNLSQLMRAERLNGPSDRDPTVATKEMISFKGPYLYVRDAEEKSRSIMVREYAKVANREDGDWPQFRSVSHGKCPFVEEVTHSRRNVARETQKERKTLSKRATDQVAPRTRAATAQLQATGMQPPSYTKPSVRVLPEDAHAGNRGRNAAAEIPATSIFGAPSAVVPSRRGSSEQVFQTVRNQHVGTGHAAARFFGGEPIASGLQQSNITSAIRSQMISSTAAAPGAKAGLSKEVHELKRKVLERNTAAPATNGMATSRRVADLAAVAKHDKVSANFRVAKRRAPEKVGLADEDFRLSEEQENLREIEAGEQARAIASRPHKTRDPKPGYCENCREKFDDFDEHTLTRLHRKFAANNENWNELDSLLIYLGRPLKDD